MIYNFKTENELEIAIPQKQHSIIMHGKLSEDGKSFTIDSQDMDGLTARRAYSREEVEYIKRKISQQSHNEDINILFN